MITYEYLAGLIMEFPSEIIKLVLKHSMMRKYTHVRVFRVRVCAYICSLLAVFDTLFYPRSAKYEIERDSNFEGIYLKKKK